MILWRLSLILLYSAPTMWRRRDRTPHAQSTRVSLIPSPSYQRLTKVGRVASSTKGGITKWLFSYPTTEIEEEEEVVFKLFFVVQVLFFLSPSQTSCRERRKKCAAASTKGQETCTCFFFCCCARSLMVDQIISLDPLSRLCSFLGQQTTTRRRRKTVYVIPTTKSANQKDAVHSFISYQIYFI